MGSYNHTGSTLNYSRPRPRPLSAIDVAIRTLSDPETTARLRLRDLDIRTGPSGDDCSFQTSQDAPRPLFYPEGMIHRDLARLKSKQPMTANDYAIMYTPLVSLPFSDDSEEEVPECWRFKNTCEGIDAHPRSGKEELGTFTKVEMDMFDPVFRRFVEDCYDYGIPGSGGEKESPAVVKPERVMNGDGRSSDTEEPYWDEETWKKWAEDVHPGYEIIPAPTTPERVYFTAFPASRPSQVIAPTSESSQDPDRAIDDSAAWWLSDPWLEAGDIKAHCPTQTRANLDKPLPALPLFSPHAVKTATTMRIYRVPHRPVPTSSRSSSDVSVVFKPLPMSLRTASDVSPSTKKVDKGGLLGRRPSKWASLRMKKLKLGL